MNIEDGSISLKVALTILCVVTVGVAGGAVWATRTDYRLSRIESRLGIQVSQQEPNPTKGPTPIWVQEAKADTR